jgi:hypothetical protein
MRSSGSGCESFAHVMIVSLLYALSRCLLALTDRPLDVTWQREKIPGEFKPSAGEFADIVPKVH